VKFVLLAWVRKPNYAQHALPTTGDAEKVMVSAQALKQIRELETENEILRHGAAYLSQTNLNFSR
jgi:ribosomal protein L28